MRFIELAETAKSRLLDDDNQFHDKAERIVGLMRSLGIVPTRRASLWGHHHKLLAAMLVTAADQDTTVDISTRRKGNLTEAGLTTSMIKWFDNLVDKQMLIPRNGAKKALGSLLLSEGLMEKLQ